MNEIRRVLRLAARRLFVLDFLARLMVTATAAIAALLALRIADAVMAWEFPWLPVFAGAAAAAVAAALAWSALARGRELAVARELDERADLRESLSTALCVEKSPDPWAQAVVETARDRARRVVVRDAIPITAPRLLPAPIAALIALVVVWFSLPSQFTWSEKVQAKVQAREVQQVKAEIKARQDELAEALQKAKVELKDEPRPEGDGGRPEERDPEAIRRAEVRRLTDVAKQLEQLKEGEKSQQLKAAREAMNKLRQPGPGPMDELSKQMARGNFEEARKELGDLAKKLGDGSLSPEQKKQLEGQLSRMSEQLARLSEDRQSLEKKLQEAGLSAEDAKKAAADPEALQKALDQQQGLTEEQKQQLMSQAKASTGACQSASAMADAMAKMAKGLGSPTGMTQEGMEGMEGLEGQLSALEMMEADMQSLDAAMKCAAKMLAEAGQCMSGGDGKGERLAFSTKQTPWREGDTNSRGSGSGGPGKGAGGNPETTEAPFDTRTEKTGVKKTSGPIIGQTLVWGEQVKGESRAQFAAVVESSERAATDSIANNLVAPEFQPAVKSYFGRLAQRAASKTPDAPAAPAGDAKDADSK